MKDVKALLAGSLVVVVAVAGCLGDARFEVGDDDDDDGCGAPPPPTYDEWCPPAWACLDGAWVDTAGACPNPCPAERPAEGSACPALGISCSYDDEYWLCGEEIMETVNVECTTAGWSTMTYRCQPEPVCPDVAPVNGSDCSGWYDAYFCDYTVDTACGEVGASAACVYQQQGEMI